MQIKVPSKQEQTLKDGEIKDSKITKDEEALYFNLTVEFSKETYEPNIRFRY
ncbi:MAG: hypothetical protein BTN85_0293 [Candidatus Methanohalarchaeum thermophilum]|uniref:Uncharacterized protein n=1 Tax=Methanohalarchaeum thermophilum TaxID=1903181 RepID=A0A1Q6DTW7_METT1|nr:MAG: hypothetical protein BTN85_0293 [Candidatus Methanohalarchaeum thermophilum]